MATYEMTLIATLVPLCMNTSLLRTIRKYSHVPMSVKIPKSSAVEYLLRTADKTSVPVKIAPEMSLVQKLFSFATEISLCCRLCFCFLLCHPPLFLLLLQTECPLSLLFPVHLGSLHYCHPRSIDLLLDSV